MLSLHERPDKGLNTEFKMWSIFYILIPDFDSLFIWPP